MAYDNYDKNSDSNIASVLLENKVLGDVKNLQTLLLSSCQLGKTLICERLLIDTEVKVGQRELGLCAIYGHLDCMKVILENGKLDPGEKSSYSFRKACEYGHIHIVKFLLADGRIKPNDDNDFSLRMAVKNNHVSTVEILLKQKGVNSATNDNYCIKFARENKFKEVSILLMNHSSKVRSSQNVGFRIKAWKNRSKYSNKAVKV
eukprot:Pgem_evm1s11710